MTCRVICISRTLAAGGEEVARAACQRLGFRYVDEEIVEKAAAKANIDPREVAEAEQRQPLVSRILDAMGASPAMEMMGMPPAFLDPAAYSAIAVTAIPAYLTQEHYAALIQDVIRETAQAGAAVIVAHAAAMALPDGDDILRILITASPEVRAKRVAAANDLSDKEAAKAVQQSDGDRRHYFKKFYGIKDESLLHYDLVINTDRLDVAGATGIVVAAATR